MSLAGPHGLAQMSLFSGGVVTRAQATNNGNAGTRIASSVASSLVVTNTVHTGQTEPCPAFLPARCAMGNMSPLGHQPAARGSGQTSRTLQIRPPPLPWSAVRRGPDPATLTPQRVQADVCSRLHRIGNTWPFAFLRQPLDVRPVGKPQLQWGGF